MKQIVLYNIAREEIGQVRIDTNSGGIEAVFKRNHEYISEPLQKLLASVANEKGLMVSKGIQQGQLLAETREKVELTDPRALSALADVLNRYPGWPQRIFAVIQNREE